jgi:hypothetical protein
VRNSDSIDKFESLQVALFSLRAANLAIVVLFTLVFSYILGAFRIAGVQSVAATAMLGYVSCVFFVGYLFVIVDYTTLGYQEIPKISGNLLTSARSRLLKELILISFFISLFLFLESTYLKLLFVIASLILFPASTAVVLMEERLVSALNPAKWVGIIMGLEADAVLGQYLLVQGVALFAGYTALFVDLGWLNLVTMSLFLMTLMTLFRSLGVLLHSNADSLGIAVRFGKKIEDEQVRAAQEREYSEFSSELYQLSNGGQVKKAWELLEERLKKDKFSTEPDFFTRLSKWDKPLLAIKVGQGFTERLIKKGDYRTAWNVLEYCYPANNNKYRLTSSDAILKLMVNAETNLRKAIVVTLIHHFEEDFPDHPKRAEALLVAARYTAQDLDDFDRAREMMEHLYSNYPEIYSDKDYQALTMILSDDKPMSSRT